MHCKWLQILQWLESIYRYTFNNFQESLRVVHLEVTSDWAHSYTEQHHHNTVNFLANIQKRHPIARPLGRGMGCFLWIQHLSDILPQILQLFM